MRKLIVVLAVLLSVSEIQAQDISVFIRHANVVDVAFEDGSRTFATVPSLGINLSQGKFSLDLALLHNGSKNVTGAQVLGTYNLHKRSLGEGWGMGVNAVAEAIYVPQFVNSIPKSVTTSMISGNVALVKKTPFGKIVLAELVGVTHNFTSGQSGLTVRTLLTVFVNF